MSRQDIRNSFDFNDQLPVHENVRAKAFVEWSIRAQAAFRLASVLLRAAPWFFVRSVLNA